MVRQSIISKLFQRYLTDGELTLITHDGERHHFGSGAPKVTWVMRTRDCLDRIVRNPELSLGETYMEQAWDVADGSLADLLRILRRNLEGQFNTTSRLHWLGGLLRSWNNVAASRRHVHHHYDLDEALFRTFLDRDMHYSCAYFRDPDLSLESAQLAKCNHIMSKLLLTPGQRVLDVGSGWGGLAMYLAEHADVHVTGLTLSEEQLRVARAEAEQRGLGDRVRFELEDYRDHHGRYDRIVSVGMFEHVGRRNYTRYFRKLHGLLNRAGIALLHTIGRSRSPRPCNPWIQRYIFPGGYIPALSEVVPAIERAALVTTDVEILRRHYAFTLREWNRRFQQHRERFVREKGERFCRMWEFYLTASQTAFELADLEIFQCQLAMPNAGVPLTRDYLYAGAPYAGTQYAGGAESGAKNGTANGVTPPQQRPLQ